MGGLGALDIPSCSGDDPDGRGAGSVGMEMEIQEDAQKQRPE